MALLFYLIVNYYYIDDYGYGFFMSGFGYSLVAVAFALLATAALSPCSWLFRWRIPGAAQLAAWSYAIYLVHKPLAVIAHRILKNAGVNPAVEAGVIAIVSIGGGYLLYRLVETPFMKCGMRVFPATLQRPAPSRRKRSPRPMPSNRRR